MSSIYVEVKKMQLIDKIYSLHVFLQGLGIALESGHEGITKALASRIPQILKDTRPIEFSDKPNDE